MELFYSVSEKRSLDDTQQTSLYSDGGACAVSSKSVVAFTRMTTRQDSFRHRIPNNGVGEQGDLPNIQQ